MIYGIIVGWITCIIGMGLVRVRSGYSWWSIFIPGINYYTRTQIAGWSFGLSMVTSIANIVLCMILGFMRYQIVGRSTNDTLGHNITQYVHHFLQLGLTSKWLLCCIVVLQVRVNWGVAHRWGRGLLSGLELTIFPMIFWILLGCQDDE